MAFNFKAFAAGFMDDQARQINERVAESREYKRELKENAEASKSKISKLKQLKGLAASEIARIRALGVDDEYINAAIASGPKGLFDLSTALQEEASRRNFRPGQKFDKFEVESLIDITENFKYGDIDSQEFYEMNTALTKPSLGSTKDSKRGLFGTLLGLDLDDAVRARLDEDAYFDGYSVMDINELAKQEAYESVAPGTYFSFAPTQAFDASKALTNFNLAVSRIESDLASDTYQATVLTQAKQLIATNPDYADKDQAELAALLTDREKNKRIFSQATILANNNPRFVEELQPVLENYGMDENAVEALRLDAMADRELEVNLANIMLQSAPEQTRDVGNRVRFTSGNNIYEAVVSEGDVISLRLAGAPENIDPRDIPEALRKIVDEGGLSSIKAAERVTGEEELTRDFDLPKPEPATVPEPLESIPESVEPRPRSRGAGKTWDQKYRGKFNASTGEPIIVSKRPEEDEVTGAGRRRKSSQDQWDNKYGDTHDPNTGYPIVEGQETVEITEALTPKEGSDIIDMQGMSDEEMDNAFDNLPIGAGYINEHGERKFKDRER